MKKLNWPKSDGWYWVKFEGYNTPNPCWFVLDTENEDDSYFLPGGLGDSSSSGVYIDDIDEIGPEIIEPKF